MSVGPSRRRVHPVSKERDPFRTELMPVAFLRRGGFASVERTRGRWMLEPVLAMKPGGATSPQDGGLVRGPVCGVASRR
jgi:hypothetical protein